MWPTRTIFAVALIALLAIAALVRPAAIPPEPSADEALPQSATEASETATETETGRPSEQRTPEIVLGRRDTLERALARAGVPRNDAVAIIESLRGTANLRRLLPGERLAAVVGPAGEVQGVTWWRSPVETHEVRRDGDGWRVDTVTTPVEVRVVAVAGRLEDSLFASMERLGESATLTARFVSLFEWDFDFAADALPGDSFRLLVEKRYADGAFIGYGDVLIAEYMSGDRAPLTAVLFSDGKGRPQYFDTAGRSVRKMFLRAPLDFTRITSGFSHARRHPILGGPRPHLAVDYGAPVGTPVRAVADGVVVSAGRNGGYGISIVIRHARGYETMYNHLSAALVRRGQRVSQRQVIGRVGSTGLSTGPHLDYRVRRSGRFVNPLGEKFLPGSPVPADQRGIFRARRDELLERLGREAPLPPEGSRS